MTDDALPPPNASAWEVLGIEPTADEREIRRGYARRIKRFRPDRAPEEFQRVHHAYEWALRARFHGAMFEAEEEEDEEEEEAAPEESSSSVPDPPPPQSTPVPLAELAALAAVSDDHLDSALIAALSAPGVTLEDVRDVLGQVRASALTSCAGLDWGILRRHAERDPDLVANLVVARAEHALRAGRTDELGTLLADVRFQVDASDSTALAEAGIRLAIVAAWRIPKSTRLIEPWAGLPTNLDIGDLLDRLDAECKASRAWREGDLPLRPSAQTLTGRADDREGPLSALIADSAVFGPSRWTELVSALRPHLDDGSLLPLCRRMVSRIAAPQIQMQQRLATPANGRSLDWLPPDTFELLGRELVGFDAHIALPPVLRALNVAHRYETVARDGFARIIGELGVQSVTLVQWLRLNGKLARSVKQFDLMLENDVAMETLGAIAERVAIGWA